jgi:PEP-CTERM motif
VHVEQVEKMMKSKLKRAAATLLFALPFSAFAVPISDPAGDLLTTFVPGDDPTLHGDTDVISSDVSYNPTTNRFNFTGTHAADIGTSKLADGTPSAIYVWGLNRGQGLPLLAAIVDDVLFDCVIVLRADGTADFIDIVGGGAPTPIAGVQISGPTISADVDGSLIPSLGVFAPEDYTWNLWPRFTLAGDIFTDPAVSDFAPNQGNAALTIVGQIPEPTGLFLLGLGLLLLAAIKPKKASA